MTFLAYHTVTHCGKNYRKFSNDVLFLQMTTCNCCFAMHHGYKVIPKIMIYCTNTGPIVKQKRARIMQTLKSQTCCSPIISERSAQLITTQQNEPKRCSKRTKTKWHHHTDALVYGGSSGFWVWLGPDVMQRRLPPQPKDTFHTVS